VTGPRRNDLFNHLLKVFGAILIINAKFPSSLNEPLELLFVT
jgi:hypothetical protein